MSTSTDIAALLVEVHDDPAAFWRLVLRGEPRRWQADVCEEIRVRLAKGERHIRVVCRTAHGAGKSVLGSALALWFTSTRPGCRGLSLGPTWATIESVVWVELAKLYRGSLLAQAGVGKLLQTELSFGDAWDFCGLNSDVAFNVEGRHGASAIRVADEAKAIPQDIFTSTEPLLDAVETVDIWLSTPSIPSGPFWARDVKGGRDIIRAHVGIDDLLDLPGKREWRDARAAEWGVNSPEYESRCMGNYVSDGEGALYPSAWVERAMNAGFEVNLTPVGGLDVAGSVAGDETALCLLAGPDDLGHMQVLSVEGWKERDTAVTAGKTLRLCREAGAVTLAVDYQGLGQGVADPMKAQIGIVEFRSGSRPQDVTRFTNAKAETAWALRSLLESGLISLPKAGLFRASKLKEQLLAMKYIVTSAGKIRVVDPSDSPDLVDSVLIALSIAAGGPPLSMADVSFGNDDGSDLRAGWGDVGASSWGNSPSRAARGNPWD
jgi:hypothetical protein